MTSNPSDQHNSPPASTPWERIKRHSIATILGLMIGGSGASVITFNVDAGGWRQQPDLSPAIYVSHSSSDSDHDELKIYSNEVILRNDSELKRNLVGSFRLDPPISTFRTIPERIFDYCHIDSITGQFTLLMSAEPDSTERVIRPREEVTIKFTSLHPFKIVNLRNLHTRFLYYSVDYAAESTGDEVSTVRDSNMFETVSLLVLVVGLTILVVLAVTDKWMRMTSKSPPQNSPIVVRMEN